jgi:hypothetical protein
MSRRAVSSSSTRPGRLQAPLRRGRGPPDGTLLDVGIPGPGGFAIKAAHLIRKLYEVPLPGPPGPEFPLPTKLTVTAISGGEGYSMVPDLCTVKVDIRLTPALDDPVAVALLHEAVAGTDAARPGTPPTGVEVTTRWPPYALPDGSPLRDALLSGATRAGLAPVAKVAGPSNIGNYLAGLGIPATAGFGVDYQSLHGRSDPNRLGRGQGLRRGALPDPGFASCSRRPGATAGALREGADPHPRLPARLLIRDGRHVDDSLARIWAKLNDEVWPA